MPELAQCPKCLPEELQALLSRFGSLWAKSGQRPRIAQHVRAYWSSLLDEWARNPNLPLFVRKSSEVRGRSVIHEESSREIIYCDNSPAHWSYIMAYNAECPSLKDVESMIQSDNIPVVMIRKKANIPLAKYHCRLRKEFNVNKFGWKLAHIESVGLRTRIPVEQLPMDLIVKRFRSLLSPSNMFVVPLEWAGIAEAKSIASAVAAVDGAFE